MINALFILSFGALPASMGVAVLKYRLYELDRIVSRVVSYALVTVLLVGVYAGLVLAATHILPHKSAVAVAGPGGGIGQDRVMIRVPYDGDEKASRHASLDRHQVIESLDLSATGTAGWGDTVTLRWVLIHVSELVRDRARDRARG